VAIPGYMVLRGSGTLDVSDLSLSIASCLEASGVSPDEVSARVESARVRFEAEDMLFERVYTNPVFGVSAVGFNQFVDRATGEMVPVTTDGFWTILLATRGITGLAAWTVLLLLPVWLFMRGHPPSAWRMPLVATGGALALVLLLYTVDCLMNANINPIYTLIAAGLVQLPALGRGRGQEKRFERPRPASSDPRIRVKSTRVTGEAPRSAP